MSCNNRGSREGSNSLNENVQRMNERFILKKNIQMKSDGNKNNNV